MRCCFIEVCKVHFFRPLKYGTDIDDVLRSLWSSAETVQLDIQTLEKDNEKCPTPVRRRFKVAHPFLGIDLLQGIGLLLVSGATVLGEVYLVPGISPSV